MKTNSSDKNSVLTSYVWPLSITGILVALTGCATDKLTVPRKLEFERTPQTNSTSVLGEQQLKREYAETDTPQMPANRTASGQQKSNTTGDAVNEKAELSVSFDQMPLPTFIQAVYGGVIKTNYSMDGAVASRTDLITFHTPKPQTRSQMSNLARMLLKSYGIAVQDFGGVIRIVPDTASNSYSPAIRRGRAQPDTPQSLRPVFYYVELDAVRVNEFSSLLKTMFGTKIQTTDDLARNAILLSGQPDDISAAMEVIQVFDQPAMRGQRTKRVSPVFWTADEFAKRLVDVLSAEGYSASTSINAGTPILILPIPPLNSVIVFSSSETIMNHTLQWARDLDKPSESQAGGAYFTYPVKYADAQALAKTLSELIGGSTPTAPVSASTPAGAAAAPAASAARGGSRIVVNNATNSLIIQGGGPDQYRQWMALLAELDKPSKSALIDVVVAEVTAGTLNTLGVDWNYKAGLADSSGNIGSGGTTNSASAGGTAGGLLFSYLSPNKLTRANFTALASKSGGEILSSPKLMARNGETATIQVADEVPILTSTSSTPTSTAGPTTTNTIQYRTAGMVLKVRPVINSGSRIDLDVSQEVSSVKSVASGGISSPTISVRKVDTKLTLRDGATVMLAGLISNNNTSSDSGVPLLKDIPGIGSLFKTENHNNSKTELIILITPYIINDDFEAEAVTDVFRDSLGDWAKDIKQNTDIKALKRNKISDAKIQDVPPLQAPAVNDVMPVTTAPKSNLPTGNGVKPASQEDATSTSMTKEKATDVVNPDESEVVMSKPEVAVPVAPAAIDKKNNKVPAKSTVPLPPGSKQIEDANLLDELRKAVEKR